MITLPILSLTRNDLLEGNRTKYNMVKNGLYFMIYILSIEGLNFFFCIRCIKLH